MSRHVQLFSRIVSRHLLPAALSRNLRKTSLNLLCFLILVGPTASRSQTATVNDRLQQAAAATSLDSGDVTPWHLKMDVQLFDGKGQPAQKGTIEEWWQSPELHRTTFTLAGETSSAVRNEQGSFRTARHALMPVLLQVLLDQVVHPMPSDDDLNTATPELRKKDFGKNKLDCIMLDSMAKLNDEAHPGLRVPLPLGLFPTYCFDPGTAVLRVTYDLGSQFVLRNGTGTFQKRTVSTSLILYEGQIKAASAQVTSLRAELPPTGSFVPGPDLQSTRDATRVEGSIIAGKSLTKTVPIYPESARRQHIAGAVVLHAIIGFDGHIRSLSVLSTPDGDLALSALSAVHTWTYEPYLLNGEPIEVDTTITVNYNFR